MKLITRLYGLLTLSAVGDYVVLRLKATEETASAFDELGAANYATDRVRCSFF